MRTYTNFDSEKLAIETRPMIVAIKQKLVQKGILCQEQCVEIGADGGVSMYELVKQRGNEVAHQLYLCFLDMGLKRAAEIMRPKILCTGRDYYEKQKVEEKLSVIVSDATERHDTDQLTIYRMGSSPKGHALVINNHCFSRSRPEDKASLMEDGQIWVHLLIGLGYDVQIKSNLTQNELKNTVTHFSAKDGHENADSMVLVVLCDGFEDKEKMHLLLLTQDRIAISHEWIIGNFNTTALKNKPKLFFFQLTRGHESRQIPQDNNNDLLNPSSASYKIGDTVIVYTCYPVETYSQGFTREICKEIMQNAKDTHLIRMLNQVGNVMKKIVYESEEETTLVIESRSFDRKLFFNPGLYDREIKSVGRLMNMQN